MTFLDKMLSLPVGEATIEKRYKLMDGSESTFNLRQFASTDEFFESRRKSQGREKAFDAAKPKRLAVQMPREWIDGKEDKFPGFKELADGKAEVYITRKESITVATLLESGLADLDKEQAWAQAVFLTLTQGPLAITISKDITELNQDASIKEAKNDSTDQEETSTEGS